MSNEIRDFSETLNNIRSELVRIKMQVDTTLKHLDKLNQFNEERCIHTNREKDIDYGGNRTIYTCMDCGLNI